MIAREKNFQREFGRLVAAAAFMMALAYMVVAVRGSSYAIWLGMPFVAAAMWKLFALFKLNNLAVRFAAALFVTPPALTLGAITLASAAGQAEPANLFPPERAGCTAKSNYRALATLPVGRMAINDPDWGAYMLAWTPHSVLAAPYHRLSSSIVLSHRIFAEPPEAARRLAAQAGLTYIVCVGSAGPPGFPSRSVRPASWSGCNPAGRRTGFSRSRATRLQAFGCGGSSAKKIAEVGRAGLISPCGPRAPPI